MPSEPTVAAYAVRFGERPGLLASGKALFCILPIRNVCRGPVAGHPEKRPGPAGQPADCPTAGNTPYIILLRSFLSRVSFSSGPPSGENNGPYATRNRGPVFLPNFINFYFLSVSSLHRFRLPPLRLPAQSADRPTAGYALYNHTAGPSFFQLHIHPPVFRFPLPPPSGENDGSHATRNRGQYLH